MIEQKEIGASSAEKLRHSAFAVSILSLLPHIVCCLLPTAAALVTLGTTVGLGAALASSSLYRIVDAYHIYLLGLAIFTVCVSGFINFAAWRIDCRSRSHIHDACEHEPCTPRKATAYRIFLISCALLLFDVSYFLFEEKVLGLHHH